MSLADLHIHTLVIQGESYNPQAHPNAVCANDTAIDFGLEVGNQGEQPTGSFAVKFLLDGHEVHNAQAHSLSHGQTQWLQWRHAPLHAGHHALTVTVDPLDRLRESNEEDNTFTHQFEVLAAMDACRTAAFEPETVTGHVDYTRYGWKAIDVTFVIKNPIGAPLEGYSNFVVFYGPENEQSSPTGHTATDEHGMLRCGNLWLKPTGTVYLTSVPNAGGRFEGTPQLQGTAHYTLPANATAVFFDVQQGKEEVTVTATSQQEASENLKLDGKVGVKFEIIELGGGVTHDQGQKQTQGRQVQWKVTVGTPALTITQSAH